LTSDLHLNILTLDELALLHWHIKGFYEQLISGLLNPL